MTVDQEKQLHAIAREYAAGLQGRGAILDKKVLRWNDIVAVGVFYGSCCTPWSSDSAAAGIREAVDACVKDDGSGKPDPQYIAGRGPLSMIHGWMAA